ncbi:MAG: retropepsin-like aspartic protease [Steroidobacteraceae bacterium]
MPKSILLTLLLACGTAQAESIPLVREHGTFVVPVVINDKMTLNFTIDSGASDVSIPAHVFSTLIRSGAISPRDFLDERVNELPGGSKRTSQRFRIRLLSVGSLKLRNVIASIAPPAGHLLLGQSFLSRLKSWSIDTQRQVLLINESSPSVSDKVAPHTDTSNQGIDWKPLPLVNDRAGQVFVNIASIRVEGNLRWFRDKRVEPRHPDNSEIKWINYTLTGWEINCDKQLAKLDEQTKYYEDGTRWVAGSDLISAMQWIAVEPNTPMEGEMKIVCTWKPE